MNSLKLSVGDLIEVKTERLAYGGDAIARYQGLAIFVQGGAPDETLRVRIIERKKSFARAVIEAVLTPSAVRREPPCKYFGDCGGCQLQHINYDAQLQAKVGFIRDALKRTGQIDWPDEIKIHSASEFNYRLRAKINIEREKFNRRKFHKYPEVLKTGSTGGGIKIGFHRANSQEVCDIEHCGILSPELNEALTSIRQTLKGDCNTLNPSQDEIDLAVGEISNSEGQVQATVPIVSISPSFSDFSTTDIQRKVAGAIYQFSPSSFFQVNASLLDQLVLEVIGTEKGDFALDLYAGVGLFTIQLGHTFNRVIGVESNIHSVRYARRNISFNEGKTPRVVCDRVDRWLKTFISQKNFQTPDLVVLDPPRSGAAESVDLIAQIQPRRIHYVSCDPNTLARDLQRLCANDYKIERIVAFDMFPQTYHVETIAFLQR